MLHLERVSFSETFSDFAHVRNIFKKSFSIISQFCFEPQIKVHCLKVVKFRKQNKLTYVGTYVLIQFHIFFVSIWSIQLFSQGDLFSDLLSYVFSSWETRATFHENHCPQSFSFFSSEDSFIRYKLEEPTWGFGLHTNNLWLPISDFHCRFVLLWEYLNFSEEMRFFFLSFFSCVWLRKLIFKCKFQPKLEEINM